MDLNKCEHCEQEDASICKVCYRVGSLMSEGEFSHRIESLEEKIEELITLLKDKQISYTYKGRNMKNVKLYQ